MGRDIGHGGLAVRISRLRRRAGRGLAGSAVALFLAVATIAPAGAGGQATTNAAVGIPADYSGLSIEPANLCYVVSLAHSDPAFVQVLANLGPGTLRVGGGTGDKLARWSPTATASCVYNAVVVTPGLVDSFFALARSVGDRVTWQVPLDNGDLAGDAAEAAYVATKSGVQSIEFGNEPNLYPNASTEYQTYVQDWNTVYRDYLADGGTAPISGPGAANKDQEPYLSTFLSQDAGDLSYVSGHYYGGSGDNPQLTCPVLLQMAGLRQAVASDVAVAKSYGLPFVMSETNTYANEGRPGVSNAFCSALWAADYMMSGLAAGLQGVYFHGTANYPAGNVGGKAEYFTPINQDGTAAPEYYGILFYLEMARGGGSLANVSVTKSPSLDSWAVAGADGSLRVGLVNLGGVQRAVTIRTPQPYSHANGLVLTAPALTSLTGTTFGGVSVASDGSWTPTPKVLKISGSTLKVTVPGYTGVVVTFTDG